MAAWMINCKDYAKLISQGMDRRLSFWDRVSLKIHQMLCPPCNQVTQQFKAIRDACRFKPFDEPPADHSDGQLSEQACEQIKQALHQEIVNSDR